MPQIVGDFADRSPDIWSGGTPILGGRSRTELPHTRAPVMLGMGGSREGPSDSPFAFVP